MPIEDPAEWTHAQHYAAVVLALRAEPKMVGAASMWNEALTHGLLALRQKAGVVEKEGKRPGAESMLSWARGDRKRCTEWGVLFGVLLEGVQRLDMERHGSARREGLKDEDLHNLYSLNDVDELDALADGPMDVDYVRAMGLNEVEFVRASRYWEMISDDLDEEEIDARVAAAGPSIAPGDAVEWNLQDCPMCGYQALVGRYADHVDHIGAGVCWLCSYERSETVAWDEGIRAKITLHDDD